MGGRQTERIGVKINAYRGFKIWYDEDDDKFYTDLNENSYSDKIKMRRVKRSGLKAIRQEINDHIKKNFDFKPFLILTGGNRDIPIKKKVVSIRKDGAMLLESDSDRRDWVKVKSKNGKIVPATDWDNLFRYDEDAEKIIANIAILEAEKDSIDNKIKEYNRKFVPLDLSFIKPYITDIEQEEK